MTLESTLDDALRRLAPLPEARVRERPAPGRWSPKEILGHLVDSAANNHPRIVLAVGREDLDFPGYEQERWVNVQRYQDEPWGVILDLWSAYNRHIVHVIAAIPRADLLRPRQKHSLHRIAWRLVDEGNPVTLEYMISDYVEHLRHHLAQIYDLTGA
jgi:hypothetical protein